MKLGKRLDKLEDHYLEDNNIGVLFVNGYHDEFDRKHTVSVKSEDRLKDYEDRITKDTVILIDDITEDML